MDVEGRGRHQDSSGHIEPELGTAPFQRPQKMKYGVAKRKIKETKGTEQKSKRKKERSPVKKGM